MAYQLIKVEHPRAGVALITLNRPERRNALSIQMREELYQALQEQRVNDDVRVLVFTGAGPCFCSGFDLSEFGKPERLDDLITSSAKLYRALWYYPKATIAAVDGPALAGGLDLLVFCDIRLCTASAVFGHPQVKFGGVPIYTPLRWIVGDTAARSLCLRGNYIDAQEALRIGLVGEVLPADGHVPRALEIAEEIMEAPPESLAFSKAYMQRSPDSSFDTSFYFEHDDSFRRRMEVIVRNRARS